MDPPFLSALGPCMMVVPEAYAGLVQERWAVFVHEVEQLVRHLHGLSVGHDGGSGGGGACGPWPPHGLRGGYPPTHPPPPPRLDPTRPKGHPGSAPEAAAYRLADGGGGSFSCPPSPPPAPRMPRGQGPAPDPGSDDAGSLRSDSGRSKASSAVVDPPFPVLPTPPRPGGRAPTAVAAADDYDDACPSCRRTRGRVDAPADEDAPRRRHRGPGLRRSLCRNRPRDVRAEYEAGETPGEAGKKGTAW